MEKSNFDTLIHRYLTGQVSEHEKVKLEAWLEVMKTGDTTDLEMSKEEEEKLFQKITSPAENIAEIMAMRPARKVALHQWVIRIAASLLIFSAVAYIVWYAVGDNPYRLEVVARDGVEKIILNDGSLVWLRNKSQLVYLEKKDEGIRYTELEGEALFEVAKDADRPFLIRCGDVTLRVLGTSFSVKTGEAGLEVKVLTGRVNLSSDADKTGVDVEPNEKVVYRNGEIEKLPMQQSEASAVTANTSYDMKFTGATLSEVAAKVGDKFNVNVNLPGREIGRCHITADFTDHSLESTLEMITEVLEVEYSRKGNTITITGDGCN